MVMPFAVVFTLIDHTNDDADDNDNNDDDDYDNNSDLCYYFFKYTMYNSQHCSERFLS